MHPQKSCEVQHGQLCSPMFQSHRTFFSLAHDIRSPSAPEKQASPPSFHSQHSTSTSSRGELHEEEWFTCVHGVFTLTRTAETHPGHPLFLPLEIHTPSWV